MRMDSLFIIVGMIFLIVGSGGALVPLAMVSFGSAQVSGISPFSAVTVFIGIVLILLGIFIKTGRRFF
jgi:hypothetical protein